MVPYVTNQGLISIPVAALESVLRQFAYKTVVILISFFTAFAIYMAIPFAPARAQEKGHWLSLDQLKTRYGGESSRYMAIGGMNIRYKDEGQGPIIVLLHGSNSSLDGYDALTANLAADYRVIRADMPGMGLSETASSDTATDTPFFDDILLEMLNRLEIDNVTLIGTSSGGAIAYYFASRFPEKVNALILSNTPSDPLDPSVIPRTPELREQLAIAKDTGFRSRKYWDVYLHWLTGPGVPVSDDKIDRYYDMNRREKFRDERSFWRLSTAFPEPFQALAGVRAPTLLIWGSHDFVLPLYALERLRHQLPASEVSTIILKNVGHYPPFEAPERFAKLVRTFRETVVQVSP